MAELYDRLISEGKLMPILGHLNELRSRIIKSIVSLVVVFSGCYFFANPILEFLKQPLLKALPVGTKSSQALHFTNPLDVFMVQLKVSLIAAIICSSPLWLYQFWKFFEPALFPNERKFILPFVFISAVLFLSGMAFCYYLMMPTSLSYLLNVGEGVATSMITITEYIDMVSLMLLGFGVVFQTPVILILLAFLKIIDDKTLSEYRKLTIVLILVLAAILTPSPDPLSQLTMAVPMYIMYEMSILMIRLLVNRKQKA